MRHIIAKRIKEARESLGLSQQELATLMGWKSHSSIVAIEQGQEIKAWELLKFAQVLRVPPESLYSEEARELSERPIVLWRQKSSDTTTILKEEQNILKQCQDYRLVERLVGITSSSTQKLPIEKFDIESVNADWANRLAEQVQQDMRLGDYPAELLAKRLEEDYGVLLMSRSIEQGAAACSRGEMGSAIVLNEKDVPWRQVFSLAHELFHLITWDIPLIEKISKDEVLFRKNEKLADAFAAALLMTQQMIDFDVRGNKLTYSLVVALARKYRVSTSAMLGRLSYLRYLPPRAFQQALNDEDFKKLDQATYRKAFQSAQIFGLRFIRLAYLAYEEGRLAKGRLAQMMGVTLRDVDAYLSEKGFCLTNDKEIEVGSS